MRVLIVDDSALMRRWLKECFDDGEFVIETARSGVDALNKLDRFNPDVVTLDVNMPEMDGLTCLANIMTSSPRPVVMISSITAKGALATMEALELGAVDYIEKPSGTVSHDIKDVFPQIIAKVRGAASARIRTAPSAPEPVAARPARTPAAPKTASAQTEEAEGPRVRKSPFDVVLIGVSTGGPSTVETVLRPIPADIAAPIVIAQHMPGPFADVFAQRLNTRLALSVEVVSKAARLEPNRAYVAGANADITLSKRNGRLVANRPIPDPARTWRPSIDRLVESAIEALPPKRILTVQLTGMGNDGAEAMATLHRLGGSTIAESEESAVIFGMPKELIRRNGAGQVLPAEKIGAAIVEMVGLSASGARQSL